MGPYKTLPEAQADNTVTVNVGSFFNAAISFLIVAAVLFLVIRAINKLRRPEKVTADPVKTKECSFCFSVISVKATRCSQCTAVLNE